MIKLAMPLLAAGLFLLGCTGQNENPNDAAHQHENEAGHSHDDANHASFTIYSDSTELFVEFPQMVTGMPVTLTAHFTRLGKIFKPLEEASITAELIVMGKVVRAETTKVSAPGIFPLKLTPVIAGNGALVFHIKTNEYSDKITIPQISVYKNDHDASHARGAEANANEVSFLKEQAWKIEFANMPVKKQAVPRVVRAAGEIIAAPEDISTLLSPASGKLYYVGALSPGTEVQSGQKLFLIAPEGINSENISRRITEATVRYENAKEEFKRAQELVTDRIISRKDFESALEKHETARADYINITKNYVAGKGIYISSANAGFLSEIDPQHGDYVLEGSKIGTVIKNQKLQIRSYVPQRYSQLLAHITGFNLKNPVSGQVYDSEALHGKVAAYGRNVMGSSSLIPVTFEIHQPGDLTSGSAIEVFIKTQAEENSIAIPASALIEEQGQFFVYVQTAGESFLRKEITIGIGDGLWVPVLSGLTEGERVVTKGAHYIKLASATGSVPAHGHEH